MTVRRSVPPWATIGRRQDPRIGYGKLQQVRIRELEDDVQRYRAAVDAQLGLLPAAGESSAQSEPA